MDARVQLPFLQVYREGLRLFEKQQWTQAIEAFERAHAIDCIDPGPMEFKARAVKHLQRAEAEKNAKNNDEEIHMAVTRTSADNPEYLRGKAAYIEGKMPEAQDLFMRAVESGCQRADLYLYLGLIAANQGSEEYALVHIKRALSFDDPDVNSHIHLHLGLMKMANSVGLYGESNAHFDANLESIHESNLMTWLFQGRLNQLRGEAAHTNKDEFFSKAFDCYNAVIEQKNHEMPHHLRLLLSMQARRLWRHYKERVFDNASISADASIAALVAKENKSIEERCVLFLAQAGLKRYEDAWKTFFELLEMPQDDRGCLYDNIPYYLKHDIFAQIVSWPANKLQQLGYTKEIDTLKVKVVDLLRVRKGENYATRLMQINAGLSTLASGTILGSILYIKQGIWVSSDPSLSGGKLKELAAQLSGVLVGMSLRVNEPGELFRLCELTKEHLKGSEKALEAYPAIYEVVFNSKPPVRPTWGSFFGAASAAVATQLRYPSPSPESTPKGVIIQRP